MTSSSCQRYRGAAIHGTADQKTVEQIIALIKAELESNHGAAAGVALQYLHRKASIRPKFKGSGAEIYRNIEIGLFEVVVHPVVLHQMIDWEVRNNRSCLRVG